MIYMKSIMSAIFVFSFFPALKNLRDAKTYLSELDTLLTKSMHQYPDLSSAIGSDFTDENNSLVNGLFVNGYDTSVHMAFVIAQRNVTSALNGFSGKVSSEKKTLMASDVCDAVANFNNDESDFPTRLARIDTDFVALSAGRKVGADVLRKTPAQWNFIRGPLMNFNRMSPPFIA